MFQEYNLLVKIENQNYGNLASDLPDPVEMLVVRKFDEKKVILGRKYNLSADVFVQNCAFWPNCMQDSQIRSYMIEIQ